MYTNDHAIYVTGIKKNITGIPVVGIVPLTVLCQTREAKAEIVQQPSRHFYLNLAKISPNQVIADFGRGSSVESESE